MSGAAGDAAACCRRRQFAAPQRFQARRFGPCAPTVEHEPPTWASGIGDTTEPCPPTRHNPDGVRSRHPARRNPSLRGCRFQTLHNLDREGKCVAFFRPFPTFCIARTKFEPAFSSAKTFASGHSFSRPGTIRTGFCFAIGSAKRLVCAARMHGKTSRGPPARNRRAGGPRDTEPETCSSQGGERRTNATQPIGTTAAKRATDRKKRAV